MKTISLVNRRQSFPVLAFNKQPRAGRQLARRNILKPFSARGRTGAGKRRGVNVGEIFDAFDQVPDAGAVFSLQLCVALPVDGDPDASMNFSCEVGDLLVPAPAPPIY